MVILWLKMLVVNSFLEDLDPGSEYLYNISVYEGNEHVILEVNETFYTNNKDGMWITLLYLTLSLYNM